ncbi:hypothetical protein ACOBR2_04855 [Telmatobacter bradus]|uniref:hypothetical protein n=1 Tax=Telmatobacter bradus TaxID=474953 RepID=UPI003B43026F
MRRSVCVALLLALALLAGDRAQAQAALLMEEPYGFFGTLNPTGHNAVYLARVCTVTPVKLRRCQPGEAGSVIARYQGIEGYDWIAIPLVPYLYAVKNEEDAPSHVDSETVRRLRIHYREVYLGDLGDNLPEGGFLHGGWSELVGVSYERRIFAFRFNTTEAQDDRLIADLNARANTTHFNLLYNNCADFARQLLNHYYPRVFKRSIFPDAGMTTPKQIAYKLMRLGHKHPEMRLTVYEIPQIPGYRKHSHSNKDISESLVTTAYAVPLAVSNPYLTGGIFVDYLVRGRSHLVPKHPLLLGPEQLSLLTGQSETAENAGGNRSQAGQAPESSSSSAGNEVQELKKQLQGGIIAYE